MKFLPLLLLLGGCASTPTDELYSQLAVCVSNTDPLSALTECGEFQDKVNQREDALQRRSNSKILCPKGSVAYCDSRWHRGCGDRLRREPAEYTCVPRWIMRDAIRRW